MPRLRLWEGTGYSVRAFLTAPAHHLSSICLGWCFQYKLELACLDRWTHGASLGSIPTLSGRSESQWCLQLTTKLKRSAPKTASSEPALKNVTSHACRRRHMWGGTSGDDTWDRQVEGATCGGGRWRGERGSMMKGTWRGVWRQGVEKGSFSLKNVTRTQPREGT